MRSPWLKGDAICLNLLPGERCGFDGRPEALLKMERGPMDVLEPGVMIREVKSRIDGWQSYDGDSKCPPTVVVSGAEERLDPAILAQAVEEMVHLRAVGETAYFRIVVAAHAAVIGDSEVRSALALLTVDDEVWVRLDAVSSEGGAGEKLSGEIFESVRSLGMERPVIIQGQFSRIRGNASSDDQTEAYVICLQRLKGGGARIPLVQICSTTRTVYCRDHSHLSLASLACIARRIRAGTGLKAEVF